ncbi:MAG TPA: hypothetical protein PK181_02595, partial [Methanothrix soehngenii]|nr:hypothetical protein [Methanothrix soehngenii]
SDKIAGIVFYESEFQSRDWKPFEDFVRRDYSDLGEKWRQQVYAKAKRELFQTFSLTPRLFSTQKLFMNLSSSKYIKMAICLGSIKRRWQGP